MTDSENLLEAQARLERSIVHVSGLVATLVQAIDKAWIILHGLPPRVADLEARVARIEALILAIQAKNGMHQEGD